jgi:hypothetical protein
MRESIEGMMLEAIFDIRDHLAKWCPFDTLEEPNSEMVKYEAPNVLIMRTESGREAMFRLSAVRLLQKQFIEATWYLSPPSPDGHASLLIGVLPLRTRSGDERIRYLMLAPRISYTEKDEDV